MLIKFCFEKKKRKMTEFITEAKAVFRIKNSLRRKEVQVGLQGYRKPLLSSRDWASSLKLLSLTFFVGKPLRRI